MGSFGAVIVAAGLGLRMQSQEKKQFIRLLEKPMFIYSVEAYRAAGTKEIVLVTLPEEIERSRSILKDYGIDGVNVVPGGERRCDSVLLGLLAISSEYVHIHDAARPFITPEIIHRVEEAVLINNAAIAAVPAKDTIKVSNTPVEEDAPHNIIDTPKRSHLFLAQTPQSFKTSLIMEAFDRAKTGGYLDEITDDASLVERSGLCDVELCMGDYTNIKITDPGDILIAESLLSED